MQHRDDELMTWISADRAVQDVSEVSEGSVTGRRKPRHKLRRKAPLLGTAAAMVVLTGAGAYALSSGSSQPQSPAGTAAASAPSAFPGQAGDPGSSVPAQAGASPNASSSASASASPSSSPSSGAGTGAGTQASASTEPQAKRSPAAPSANREQSASASAGRPTGAGPVGGDPSVRGPRQSTQAVKDAQAMSLQLLNAERATVGLPPLVLKQDLSDFAQGWAKHMRTTGFGHSSDGDTAYLKTGSRTWIGENIVMWSDSSMTAQEAAEKFQSMWRHSPGHYKAQTNPKFTEVGVGIYHDESGWWGVHNFSDGK